MNNNNFQCGLDFGTSNSVITISDLNTKEQVFSYSDSSLLYFPEVNDMVYFVGKEAQNKYVEEKMKGRLLKSVKSLLRQDNFLYTWIYGKKLTPDELATLLIKNLKNKAEEYLGKEILEVVLGRPAVFSENPKKEQIAENRLLTAAHNAGFKDVRLQLEPIAAAFSYEKNLIRPEKVLVADFGGGTSDFTIMNLSSNRIFDKDRKSDILIHGGLYIGGDLFDSEIMWHKVTPHLGRGVKYKSYNKELEIPSVLFRELRNWERSFLLKDSKLRRSIDSYYVFSGNNYLINNLRVLIDNNYIFSLFKKIEKSKIDLSTQKETLIEFEENVISISEQFNIDDFEKTIQQYTDDIRNYILELMNTINVAPKDIDAVFITGGSSLVVPIRNIFHQIFGKEKIHSGDTFNSVAYGLSISY